MRFAILIKDGTTAVFAEFHGKQVLFKGSLGFLLADLSSGSRKAKKEHDNHKFLHIRTPYIQS